MSLSDTDKTVLEVSAFTTLDNTGDFLYINADVDDENNFKIWYIPKIADSDATATTLGEVIGVYVGSVRSHPDLSNAYFFLGRQGSETGGLYCLRSWVSDGYLTNDETSALVLAVLSTFTKL